MALLACCCLLVLKLNFPQAAFITTRRKVALAEPTWFKYFRCADHTLILLIRRYGIAPKASLESNSEWQVWLSILGKQPRWFSGAFLAMLTYLGCGFAGLFALYMSPVLRNSYFVVLSAVFVAYGCIQSWTFARLRYDPIRQGVACLVSMLTELANTNTPVKTPEVGPDKGPSLTIKTETKNED
jgi:hypothetical protein